jgi:hypothetical protein
MITPTNISNVMEHAPLCDISLPTYRGWTVFREKRFKDYANVPWDDERINAAYTQATTEMNRRRLPNSGHMCDLRT